MLMSLYISPLLMLLSTINHMNYASYITFVNESINCLAMWAAHHIQSSLILNSKHACVFVFNLIFFCYLKFKPSKYCLTEVPSKLNRTYRKMFIGQGQKLYNFARTIHEHH